MEYLLKASLVLIIFYACYKLFLQRETFFQHNRWYFITGIILSLIFPFAIIPKYIIIDAPTIIEATHYAQELSTTNPKIEWLHIVSYVYLLGALLFTLQFISQFGSLIVLLLKSPKHKNDNFTYVIVKSKISPFSFFKWIVYNPESFNDQELNIMLTHEKIHATQLHSIDIIAVQLACVIFWFNPLIWLYKKELKQNLEYIADYKTQNNIEDTKAYQHLLLKTSVSNYNVSISNNLYNSLIKERIVMLKKSRSTKTKQLKYLLLLPLLAGALMSMNTKEVYITNPTTKATNTKKVMEFVITKHTTNKKLQDIKNHLKKKGVHFKYKGVKRNNSNEITAIKLDATSKNSNVNYNISDNDGITSITIVFDEKSNSISIGNMHTKKHKYHTYIHHADDDENENRIIIKSNGKEGKVKKIKTTKNIQVFSDNDDQIIEIKVDSDAKGKTEQIIINDEVIDIDADAIIIKGKPVVKEKIIIKNDENTNEDKEILIIKESDHTNDIIILDDNGKNPLIIIDNKEATKAQFKALTPNDIQSVNVLKGKKAEEKYGAKAKDGVIEISTKN